MKDGRTHLAHKAEHAVDLDTGALVAVTLQDAEQGDTTTIVETLITAAEQVEATAAPAASRRSSRTRGTTATRRWWISPRWACGRTVAEPDAADATGLERRTRSAGLRESAPDPGRARQRLMRRRGELAERSFAHLYDTGGMRRTHLRGHDNIRKRLLIHGGGFNLGLVMRHLSGMGRRGVPGRPRDAA